MPVSLQHFWRGEAYLRQEFSRMGAATLRGEGLDGASRLAALPGKGTPSPRRANRTTNIAASAALLPIAPEMAWAVPQLLKRIQLVSPGIASTSGVLRSLIRMPEWDEQFAKAFADSGFLSCDRAIERVRWKYDITEMMANRRECIGLASTGALPRPPGAAPHEAASRLGSGADRASDADFMVSGTSHDPVAGAALRATSRASHEERTRRSGYWLDWRAGMADAIPDPASRSRPPR